MAERAYRALLARLRLRDQHRTALLARGLTNAQIARHGYVSSPATVPERQALATAVVQELGQELAGVVPGFVRRGGSLDLACKGGELLIPIRDAVGCIVGIRRRADHPDDGGKYRWFSAGDGPNSIAIDGNTLHVARPEHSTSVRHAVVTEGEIKANIAADRLGCVVLAAPGVANTGHVLETLQDLGNVEHVAIAYDADSVSNPAVAAAERRLGQMLTEAGFPVCRWIWDAALGKGLDDLLQAGGVPFPIPWTPPAVGKADEVSKPESTVATLVSLLQNPHLKLTQIRAAVRTAALIEYKRSQGQVDVDGNVVVTAAEVSGDWRGAPREDGEHVAAFNVDGSRPLMDRKSVRPFMLNGAERGLLDVEERRTTRRRANGSIYHDSDWVVRPKMSMATMLGPWANYRPEEVKPRKVREARVCQSCGEAHPLRHEVWCTGCGGRAQEDRIVTPEQPEPPISMSGNFPDMEKTEESASPLALVRNVEKFSRHGESITVEPVWIDAAPDSIGRDDDGDSWLFHDVQDLDALLTPVTVQQRGTSALKPRRETLAMPAGVVGDDRWTA